METTRLQKSLIKCYAKWLCMKECKSRTCQTKKYCINQKRFDSFKEKLLKTGKEK